MVVAVLALGLSTGLSATRAYAAPLVTNGGFEADTTNGGVITPPTGWTVTGDAGADSVFPFAGLNNGFLGIGVLQQSVASQAGAGYTLSFVLAPDPTTLQDLAATMAVSFGGVALPIISSTAFASTAYLPFSYQVVGGASPSALVFNGFTTNDAGNWFVDSVVLTANVVAAPEPSSAAIVGGALAALALVWATRRRTRQLP